MATPKVRPLTPLRPDVPESLEATVLKALSPEVNRRFPTTDDLARALMDELLRMGALPSKLQVGEYVKSLCDESFSTQQKLLTKVSTLRRAQATQASTPATQPMPDRATPTTVDATVVRPSGEHPISAPPVPTPMAGSNAVASTPAVATPAPLTTGQLEAAALKRGRGPLVALAVVALLVVGVGVGVVVMRGGASGAGAGAAGSGTASAGTTGAGTAGAGATAAGTTGAGTAAAGAAGAGTTGAGATDAGMTGASATGPDTTGTPGAEATDGATAMAGPPPGQGGSDAPPPPGQGATDAPPPPGVGGLNAPPPPGGDVPPPTDTEPAGAAALSARVRFTGSSYVLSNTSKVKWTGCTVLAPGQRVAPLSSLGAGNALELPVSAFRVDASQARLTREVRIHCAQGSGRAAFR
jgi:hypothetical protein